MKNQKLLFGIMFAIFLMSIGFASALTVSSATNNVTSIDGNYTVIKFLQNGSVTFTGASQNISILVIAGGGGGGDDLAGGGGAGGLKYNSSFLLSSGSYNATVGLGGAGGNDSRGTANQRGKPGLNSSFSTLNANGGGGGTGYNGNTGGDGGSGGGGGSTPADACGSAAGGTATPSGQGNNGGAGNCYTGGSGGGAGGAGNTGATGTGGPGSHGGVGVNYTISGSNQNYSGGGGGAGYSGGSVGKGGSAVGGDATSTNNAVGGNAVANTGSGGGGGGQFAKGGDGSSGIIILRFLNGETSSNAAPTISSIVVSNSIGVSGSAFNYNQQLNNITAIINDTDNNVSTMSVNLSLFYPDGSLAISNVVMRNVSNSGSFTYGMWNYSTSILLDRTGDWLVNITANDGTNNVWLNYTFTVSKAANASVTDGYFGWDTRNIPNSSSMTNILSYGYNLIGHRLIHSQWATNWTNLKSNVNASFVQNAKSFITIYFDKGNYTTYSAECANITNNITDLKSYPYSDAMAFIVIEVNNTGVGNISNFINQVSACVLSATNNLVPVYTSWNGTVGLSGDYVTKWSMIRISESTNASYVTQENNYLRNSTSLTRIYNGTTDGYRVLTKSYFTKIINNLRAKPTAINQPGYPKIAQMSNGDIVLFNNNTAGTLSFNSSIKNSDIWDFTNKALFKNVSANITVTIANYSFTLLFVDNYTRMVMTGSSSATLYKGQSALTSRMNYIANGSADATLAIVGAYDAREELWDPTYGFSNLMFHSYEQLEYSQIVDFSPYNFVVIAKGSNTPAIVNASLQTTVYPGILNRTYGYVSVADYNNTYANGTNITNCSVVNPWETNKIAEVDVWMLNYSTNVFIDGFDIGYSITPTCFNDRVKRVGDYIRYSRSKKVIFNTYTVYQDVANYGDKIMRESCFSRWAGDVNTPTYSYENMSLMITNANFMVANNKPVICMAFGDVNDYDKMAWDYYAFAVMYGYTTALGENNTFRYAQPNFQIQREIRVPNFGSQMQNSYDTSNSNYWTRRYSNGVVYFSPYRNYTFSNGQYYWFDNGQSTSSLTFTGQFQIYGATCNASVYGINMIVNDNVTRIIDPCVDIGAMQWTANWVTKDFTASYVDNGHYYVRLLPYSRAEATGTNVYSRANTKTGVHSWWDASALNPPTSEADWTSYGRSGTIGDINTTNFQFNITVAKTTSASVDSISAIAQSVTTNVTGLKSAVFNLSSTSTINISTLSDVFTFNSTRQITLSYNGTTLNYTDNADCLTINPTMTNNTVNGNVIGVCRVNVTGGYTFRVNVPHMSEWIFNMGESNTAPTVANVTINPTTAYANTDLTCNGTYNDAEGDAEASTWKWYVNHINTSVTTKGIAASLGLYVAGDNVTCEYTPNDGFVSGTPVNSSDLTISSYALILSNMSVKSSNGSISPLYYSDVLGNVSVSVLDATKNVSSITMSVSVYYPNGSRAINYSMANISNSGNFTNGTWNYYVNYSLVIIGNWSVNITASDTLTTANVSSIVVVNIPPAPIISGVSIVPNPAYYNVSLNCSGIYSGYLPESGSVWKWYKKTLFNATFVLMTGYNTQSLSGSSGLFEATDILYCEYTPSDSLSNGTPVNSSALSIINPPVDPILGSGGNGGGTGGSTTYTSSTLSCPSGTIPNGTSCISTSLINSSSWRIDSDLSNSLVHLSVSTAKSFKLTYYSNNVLADPTIITAKIMAEGRDYKIDLVRESLGVYRFQYDFVGFKPGKVDVVIMFDGHPKTLVLTLDADSAPIAKAKDFFGTGKTYIDNNRSTASVIVICVTLGICLLIAGIYYGTRKKSKPKFAK